MPPQVLADQPVWVRQSWGLWPATAGEHINKSAGWFCRCCLSKHPSLAIAPSSVQLQLLWYSSFGTKQCAMCTRQWLACHLLCLGPEAGVCRSTHFSLRECALCACLCSCHKTCLQANQQRPHTPLAASAGWRSSSWGGGRGCAQHMGQAGTSAEGGPGQPDTG
jgi:hypothetical protein